MSGPIKTTHSRSANVVAANPSRMESKDGKRWACGRNVKRAEADRRYSIVEVWTLKMRNPNGRVLIASSHCSREDAVKWVAA